MTKLSQGEIRLDYKNVLLLSTRYMILYKSVLCSDSKSQDQLIFLYVIGISNVECLYFFKRVITPQRKTDSKASYFCFLNCNKPNALKTFLPLHRDLKLKRAVYISRS